MTADPHHIRLLAARLRRQAEGVRLLAARAGQVREVAWRSLAAQAFRARVGDLMTGLHRTAGDIDEAALVLDGHARALESAQDTVMRATALAERAAHAAVAQVTRAVG